MEKSIVYLKRCRIFDPETMMSTIKTNIMKVLKSVLRELSLMAKAIHSVKR